MIAEDDTLETLEAKIHEVEHRLYPRGRSSCIAEDRVHVDGRRVHILPRRLARCADASSAEYLPLIYSCPVPPPMAAGTCMGKESE